MRTCAWAFSTAWCRTPGLWRPSRARGHDVTKQPHAVRARIGYLSTTSGLPSRLTCREILKTFAGLYRIPTPADRIATVIEQHAITEFADRPVETLSTGMRQRLRIATVTLHKPPVLILDEPTLGLDVISAEALLSAVRATRDEGTTVIYSTHQLEDAARLCDRIGVLVDGDIRAVDTVAGLQSLGVNVS